MNRFLRFARRYEGIKDTLREQAELELGRANQARAVLEEKLNSAVSERLAAMANRSQSANALELSAWHQYITALRFLERQLTDEVSIAEQEVVRRKFEVAEAYVAWKKWGKVVETKQRIVDAWTSKSEQNAADERAVIEYGRRDG